jgi:hypothetical protein
MLRVYVFSISVHIRNTITRTEQHVKACFDLRSYGLFNVKETQKGSQRGLTTGRKNKRDCKGIREKGGKEIKIRTFM